MYHYSLAKSHRILRRAFSYYQKRQAALSPEELATFKEELMALEEAIGQKDKKGASAIAKRTNKFLHKHFPKRAADHVKELIGALAFAIVVAFCIRQFWFELYEVPTGSMRPTIEELDRLAVSKTTFGINVPFTSGLQLYKDSYLNRAGIIVFTVAGMDVPDSDTRYFYLFPGKKRFIKRLMGKPGDTLYFYGGRIYGVDSQGNAIEHLADEEWLKKMQIDHIDHVPYISFEGRVKVEDPLSQNVYGSALLHQMNLPLGKLQLSKRGRIEGHFFNGKEWVRDNPAALKAERTTPQSYSDLWGIKNYAMTRLLTEEEANSFYGPGSAITEAPLYLELRHTPNLSSPKPELRQSDRFVTEPTLTPYAALLPLQKEQLQRLMDHMVTARFYVKNGRAYRYSEVGRRVQPKQFDPKMPGVPDGLYEFYDGVAYAIHTGGIRSKLDHNHPLYDFSIDRIRTLFNLGIHFNTLYKPLRPNQAFVPQRFTYFRDGDLFVMGTPILQQADSALEKFVEKELEKQKNSSAQAPYIAFVDHGPPMKDGKIDVEFIKAFGLKIPGDAVLALGDNYAMSADSRDFGFVPVHNLRGSPAFTFWPPGSRIGKLPQPSYSWVRTPNVLVWAGAILIIFIAWFWAQKKRKKRLF